MKFLFATMVLIATMSASAFASGRDEGEKEFARKISVLKQMAYGEVAIHKVRGEDAQDMVTKLYMKDTHETLKEALENLTWDAKAKDIGFAEESGWGTFTAAEASKFFANLYEDEDVHGNQKDISKRIAVGQALIKELGQMNAKFGFTSNSSGYCGIGHRGLLLIDETNEKVHEIAMGPSGGC